MVDEITGGTLSSAGEIFSNRKSSESSGKNPAVNDQGGQGHGISWFLILSGIGFLGAGAALIFAPHLPERLANIGQTLAAAGILPGMVILSGIVLFGMGLVACTVGNIAPPPLPEKKPTGNSEFMLVAHQLATDLAQSRTSILQIRESITALDEGQRTLREGLRKQNQLGEGEQNSIFRLAASVDQLNARIDGHMQKFDSHLGMHVAGIARSVDVAVERVATHIESNAAALATSLAGAHQLPTPRPTMPTEAAAPSQALEKGVVRAIEGLENTLEEEQSAMFVHPMDNEVLGELGDLAEMDDLFDQAENAPPPQALPSPGPDVDTSLDFFDEMDKPGTSTGATQLETPSSFDGLDGLLPD